MFQLLHEQTLANALSWLRCHHPQRKEGIITHFGKSIPFIKQGFGDQNNQSDTFESNLNERSEIVSEKSAFSIMIPTTKIVVLRYDATRYDAT